MGGWSKTTLQFIARLHFILRNDDSCRERGLYYCSCGYYLYLNYFPMKSISHLLIMMVAALGASYLLPGVAISGIASALILAFVLGVLNYFVKPLLIILTLPINILTFGLFTLVVNTVIILLAEVITPGFETDGFFSALLFGIIVALVAYILHKIF